MSLSYGIVMSSFILFYLQHGFNHFCISDIALRKPIHIHPSQALLTTSRHHETDRSLTLAQQPVPPSDAAQRKPSAPREPEH